ncbi:hypothetical protein Pelo_18771 [Pelomyxa schiedti]|nr:hypothetical protein Pelo_18771 [Pelomyxa schiedti]
MQQQETSRLFPVGHDDTIGPESCVFATTAHSQFLALAASSHPRCGALSPARPLCAVPSLVGGSLWRDLVLATATRFALVVAVDTDHYLLVVGVSPLLLSVTHEARWGPLRPSRQMVSHRTGISRCFAPCSFLMFGDWQESPYQRVPHTIPTGGMCMYFNGNWIVLHNKQSEGESTLSIWKIGGESLLTTTSSEGFPSVEMEPFVMPISWGGKPYSDAFCFNKMDPDEAVVITGDTRTDRTSFTLIDMRNTHESKSLVTVLKMETEGRFGNFGIKSFVMRRMCGSVVFVVQIIQGVFKVESKTGSATRICSGCTYLGRIHCGIATTQRHL